MRIMLNRQGDILPPLYYDLYPGHNLEDLPFWLDLAYRQSSPLLELGCGTGRVFLPLILAGYQAIGLDHDRRMLDYLLQANHLDLNRWLICADMTTFHLGLAFNLIIIPCNTYATFPENTRRQTLRQVFQHLRPAGLLAISLPNPVVLRSLPKHNPPELEEIVAHPIDGNPVQISSAWERSTNQLTIFWYYDHLFTDGRIERFSFHQAYYLASVDNYLDELRWAGFTHLTIFGNFHHSSYSENSPDLIILASV
jgi:SAM-dependent methyltransferase